MFTVESLTHGEGVRIGDEALGRECHAFNTRRVLVTAEGRRSRWCVRISCAVKQGEKPWLMHAQEWLWLSTTTTTTHSMGNGGRTGHFRRR
jgi:hypothetical protein